MKKFENSHVYASGAFPATTAIDATGPSTQDGTEWIKLGIDDDWGWKQAVLSEGGVTPSGVTETATVSDMLAAMKSLFFFDNLITGLVSSNNVTDAQHDIDVSVGKCMDSTNVYLLKLTAGLIKQIDASWAAGTNAGGLFTGAVAADTHYGVFLIRKDSDGTIDAGFDVSPVAANIPVGYTAYRRIGWVITDSSSNILGFNAVELAGGGVGYEWDTMISDHSSTSAITARTLVTVSAPINSVADIVFGYASSTTDRAWVRSASAADIIPSSTNFTNQTDANSHLSSIGIQLQVGPSSQVAIRSLTDTPSFGKTINTLGYLDSRL